MFEEFKRVNRNTLVFTALGFIFFIGGFFNKLSLIASGIAFVIAFVNMYKWSKMEKSDEPLFGEDEEDLFRAPRTTVYATTPRKIEKDEDDQE
jgi:predicted membrane protein